MLNLKSQKGSITVLALSSCLFFLASVTTVYMYMQSKQVAVEREYRQIKSIYENNLDDFNITIDDLRGESTGG